MAAIILPNRLRAQPYGSGRIDGSNPLTRGLVCAVSPSLGIINAVSGATLSHFDALNRTPIVSSKLGLTAFGHSLSAHGHTLNLGPGFGAAVQAEGYTIFSLARPMTSAGVGNLASFMDNSGLYRVQLRQNGGDWEAYHRAGGDLPVFASGYLSIYEYQAVATTWDLRSTEQAIYWDGTIVEAATGIDALDTDPRSQTFGRDPAGQPFVGDIALTLTWTRALSASEIADLSENPWQVFAAPARRIYVDAVAGGPAEITGALDSAETGGDALSSSGGVDVSGALATAEAGQDSAASTAVASVSSVLGAAESGADAVAASVAVRVAGALVTSEAGADTFAADAAGAGVVGAMVAAESGADALAGAGAVPVAASLDCAELGADTGAGEGAVRVSGAAAAAETGADTLAATGGARTQGALAADEAPGADTLAGLASLVITGALTAADVGGDVPSAIGAVHIAVSMAAIEAAVDTFYGTTAEPTTTGSIIATEAASDTAALSVGVLVVGAVSVAEAAGDVAACSASASVGASCALAETGADQAAGSGTVPVSGAMAATDNGPDTAVASMSAPVLGGLSAPEAGVDAAAGSGSAIVGAALVCVEGGPDVAGAFGAAQSIGAMSAVESGSDIAAVGGYADVLGTLAGIEGASDAFEGSAAQIHVWSFAAAESDMDGFLGVGELGDGPLSPISAYTIDARPRTYTIKTATTRRAHPVIYRDHFSAKDPTESLVLTFDFGALASSVASPVVTAERYSGAADSSPEAMISGAAQVDGAKVLQRVVGGVAGCTYVMRARCNTADGSVLVEAGLLPVEAAR
jgi:hypothetical protein